MKAQEVLGITKSTEDEEQDSSYSSCRAKPKYSEEQSMLQMQQPLATRIKLLRKKVEQEIQYSYKGKKTNGCFNCICVKKVFHKK